MRLWVSSRVWFSGLQLCTATCCHPHMATWQVPVWWPKTFRWVPHRAALSCESQHPHVDFFGDVAGEQLPDAILKLSALKWKLPVFMPLPPLAVRFPHPPPSPSTFSFNHLCSNTTFHKPTSDLDPILHLVISNKWDSRPFHILNLINLK